MVKVYKNKPLLIFSLSFLTLLIFGSNYITDLSASRIMTIEALVEHKTFAINSSKLFTTIDKIYHNGNFYSSKPPFVSIVGASVYYIYKLMSGAEFDLTVYLIIKIFTVGIPFSLLLVFFYKSLSSHNISEKSKLLTTFLLGFATILFPYSVILQNHTMSAFLIFLSFYCLLKNRLDGEKKYLIFLCGLFASLSVATEFIQSSLILFVFFVYLIITLQNKKNILWFVISLIPVAILYIIYNIHTTGSYLPPYANFNSLYLFENSYWQNPVGIDAFSHPKLLYFFNIIFGTHGLLLYSPILILGFVGLYKIIKNKENKLYGIALCAGFSILLVIAIIGFFTSNYGGTTLGGRWFIILYPLIMFFSVPIIDKIKKLKHIIILAIIIVFSLALNFYGMPGKWYPTTFNLFGIEMASPIYDIFRANF